MATTVSLAQRRLTATRRADKRIFGLAQALKVSLPDAPAFSRNNDFKAVKREEYLADCLHVILHELTNGESVHLKEEEPNVIGEYIAPDDSLNPAPTPVEAPMTKAAISKEIIAGHRIGFFKGMTDNQITELYGATPEELVRLREIYPPEEFATAVSQVETGQPQGTTPLIGPGDIDPNKPSTVTPLVDLTADPPQGDGQPQQPAKPVEPAVEELGIDQ